MSKAGKGPYTRQAWTEPCANKVQKKQVLSGGLVKPAKPERKTKDTFSNTDTESATPTE